MYVQDCTPAVRSGGLNHRSRAQDLSRVFHRFRVRALGRTGSPSLMPDGGNDCSFCRKDQEERLSTYTGLNSVLEKMQPICLRISDNNQLLEIKKPLNEIP